MYPPSHRLFFSKFTILNMYPILRVGLKSKQVVVGWFYNIHALIAPVDIFCSAVQHGGTHGPQLSLQMTFSPSSLCCMCAMSSSRLGGSSQLSSVPTRFLCPVSHHIFTLQSWYYQVAVSLGLSDKHYCPRCSWDQPYFLWSSRIFFTYFSQQCISSWILVTSCWLYLS